MFKKILIPLDGSDNSEKIGNFATGVARALGAEISLLTVVDPETFHRPNGELVEILNSQSDVPQDESTSTDGDSGLSDEGGERRLVDSAIFRAERYLKYEADRLIVPGLVISTHVAIGKPVDEIVQRISEINADLVAMATHRGSVIARGVLGSNTDRVIRSSTVPVMTIRPGELDKFVGNEGAPNVLVVPLHRSEMSEQAVGPALEIARSSGAEIVFIEVVQQLVGMGVEYYYAGNEDRDQSIAYLQQFVEKAETLGVKASADVMTGPPAVRIIEKAQEFDGSLIVISSHGSAGLKRWVVGSVADKVIRSSRRPVVVIPPNDREATSTP